MSRVAGHRRHRAELLEAPLRPWEVADGRDLHCPAVLDAVPTHVPSPALSDVAFPPAAPARGGESSSAALSAAVLCAGELGHALKVAVLRPHAPPKSPRADWERTGSRETLAALIPSSPAQSKSPR